MMRFLNRIKENSMVAVFLNLKGNPKACICTEPLWYIPYNLFIPFATVYMYKLGVNDTQIGFILSIAMIVQMAAAFFGGVVTDKLGRRLTTLLSDAISWSIPCIIWAFAQNFWWFLVAALLNAILQISNNSWACLLVEDCDKKVIVTVYSWIEISGLLAVFFAPISTFLVGRFDTVLVVRCLYLFAAVSMTAKFVLLYRFGSETEQGKRRMEETKQIPISRMFLGYGQVFQKMIHSKEMLLVLFVMTSYQIFNNTVIQNFFGLYSTQNLGIDEKWLPIFPMLRAAIMIVFMFTIQPAASRLPYRPVLCLGYLTFIFSHLLLIFTPERMLELVFLYMFLEACSLACIVPRKESLNALFVDKQERSRVSGLLYVMMIAVSAPFGWLIGFLSSVNRILPFLFNILIFVISFVVILKSSAITKLDSEMKEKS